MNGIIYCRVSSKEQIEGTSLETQELACRDYARSKNCFEFELVQPIQPSVHPAGH
jgi:DNA invertase Pin-like site-specific DNA recombinase